MPQTLRLKISGLDDASRVAALKRSLGLVADVQSVVVDPERGEVVVSGDPEEHRVVVHLANEGFEAHPVHEPVGHLDTGRPASPRFSQHKGVALDSNRVRDAGNPVGGKVEAVAGRLTGWTTTQARSKVGEMSAKAARGHGATVGAELDGFVAARPMTALLVAVGFGYVLAYLMRR